MKEKTLAVIVFLAFGLWLILGAVIALIEHLRANRIPRRSTSITPASQDRPSLTTHEVMERNRKQIERIDRLLANNFLYPRG
jgi:hypothetical protein